MRPSGAMRLGFYAQGKGEHLDMAKHLIASSKRFMPDVPIYQLTDGETPCLEGAEALRIAGDIPMGVRRLMHYDREGDWLFVDTDVVIHKDVRHVFERDFDVAMASRVGTYMEGAPYTKANPYNFGVVFSRNPECWRKLVPILKTMEPQWQRWGGEQLLACQLGVGYKLEVLPCWYNFTPEKQTDSLTAAYIVHYKGPRKAWITMPP